MTIRTPASAEAIARAIKAQLALENGVDDLALRLPLSVVADRRDPRDRDWSLDNLECDEALRTSVARAAAEVSRSYKLDS